MGKRVSIALAAWLLLSSLAACQSDDFGISDEVEDEGDVQDGTPFLLARKFLPGKDLVKGRNTSIAIELYNAGKSAAYDVKVVDSDWNAAFFTLSGGSLSNTIDRIPAGVTERVEFFITPQQTGSGIAQPAKVTYRLQQDDKATQTVYSTPLGLSIITPFQLNARTALRWGSYLTLGSFTTTQHWRNAAIITVVVAAASLGLWVYTSVKEANKSKQYHKALSEVEKMK